MTKTHNNSTSENPRQRNKKGSVLVARSRTGKGVFARRRYGASEIIGEITGEVFNDANYASDYCFLIGEHTCLEPEYPFRFINHSCDPNCEFDWFDLVSAGETTPRKRVLLFAMRDVKPGDELTIDYNWGATAAIPCRCRSTSCRGWIVDADEVEKVSRLASGAQDRT